MLRAFLVSAFLTEVVAAARNLDARKVHKGAPCFAKHMAGAKGARLQDAQRVLKGAHHTARAMEGERGVRIKGVRFAQGACMGVPYTVFDMVGVRDVPCPDAPRVRGGEQIIVFVMVGVKGASTKGVERVPKVALIIARHMV